MTEEISRVVHVNYGDIITDILMTPYELNIVCDHIKSMPEDGLFVEWGSGGSTCKWLDILSDNQKLISIEHNENWYNRVSRAVNQHFGDLGDKFKYYHIPEQHGFEHGYASILEEHPVGLDEYLNPDNKDIWNADIFFIDGVGRAACLINVLLRRKKKNSVIFLHDYAGRENWYNWSVQLLEKETYPHQENPTLCKLYEKEL